MKPLRAKLLGAAVQGAVAFVRATSAPSSDPAAQARRGLLRAAGAIWSTLDASRAAPLPAGPSRAPKRAPRAKPLRAPPVVVASAGAVVGHTTATVDGREVRADVVDAASVRGSR